MWRSTVVCNCKNPYASKKGTLELIETSPLLDCWLDTLSLQGVALFVVLVLLFDLTKKTQIAKLHRNVLVVDLLKFY
jgi:hypothetical protein